LITDSEKKIENFLVGYDQQKLGSIKMIIYICETINNDLKALAEKNNIELINYNDFINIGKKDTVQTNNLVINFKLKKPKCS
jgi:hypothetical protein